MKVLIACGASGGHIFPGVAVGSSIKDKVRGAEVLFVGSRRYLDLHIFKKEGCAFASLSSNKLPYGLSCALPVFFMRLLFDMVKAAIIIGRFRPDVVIGFGGYVSFPVVTVSRFAGIPVIVHEQNVVPGRANALLFRCADRVAASFNETLAYIPRCVREKVVVTGNPIRKTLLSNDREGAAGDYAFDRDKFTILVIGGSQGAHNLNMIVSESLTSMKEDARRSIQVIHIAGVRDREWVETAYRRSGITSRVFSFVDRIDRAYSIADLVCSRSGAAALFEIAFYGKPMVLVPYPYAGSHQRENALVFSQKGAAVYKEEKNLDVGEFRSLIEELMKDKSRRESMSRASRLLSVPDASDRLTELAIALGRGA